MTNPADQMNTQPQAEFRRLPADNISPSGMGAETGDFWSIWAAARRLLPAETSASLLHGLTGGATRRRDDPLVYNDLAEWVAPGLAALDIRVVMTPLPADKAECAALLRACVRGGRLVPVLLFGEKVGADEGEGEAEAYVPTGGGEGPEKTGLEKTGLEKTGLEKTGLEKVGVEQTGPEQTCLEQTDFAGAEGIAAESALVRQWLILEAVQGLDEMRVVDETGQRLTVGVSWLLAGTAVVVRLSRQPHRGTRRAGLRTALRRWAVFAAACPERLVTPHEEDAPLRALAVEFLRQTAGTRGDRVRGMLRRAADGLENAVWEEDVQDAFDYLRAAVCLEFRLTPTEMNALISPPTHVLSDIERRELIYLARAGVRDLRVFAARRLATEVGHDDAKRTLEQLRYDPDAWVRAVCGGG